MRPGSRLLLCVLTLLLAWVPAARAHDVPGTAIYLDIGEQRVETEIQIPIDQLRAALERPIPRVLSAVDTDLLRSYVEQHLRATARDARPFEIRIRSLALQHVKDGVVVNVLAELRAPPGAAARWFELGFDAVVHRVVTHNLYVFVRNDVKSGLLGEKPELLGMLHYQNKSLVIDRTSGSTWQGFRSVFLLGTRHIAEGTDHLLFLLMLLLPASLLAERGRWTRPGGAARSVRATLQIVTAFTVGHSFTLVVGALGGAQLPSQPVEVLIAISILVSAVHALRPLFVGKELLIAAGFGLIHGLAFASVLSRFGFDRSTLWLSVLGFNLGVEVMQLVVVGVTMPWLILLSRSPSYRVLRIGGALFGGVAACGWILQRAFGLDTRIPAAVESVATNAPFLLGALAVLALGRLLLRVRAGRLLPQQPAVP